MLLVQHLLAEINSVIIVPCWTPINKSDFVCSVADTMDPCLSISQHDAELSPRGLLTFHLL